MLQYLELENFEILKSFKSDLGDFTVIIGDSNSGKSSIIRALQKVLYNDRGSVDITHGHKKCRIKVRVDDKDIQYERKQDGGISYWLGQEEFKKAGIMPSGIRDIIGLVDEGQLRVNVSEQFNSLFLLNLSGSNLAEVFSNLFNLREAFFVVDEVDSDLRDITKKVKYNLEKITDIESKIVDINEEKIDAIFEDITKWNKRIEGIKQRRETLKSYIYIKQKLGVVDKIRDIHIEDIERKIYRYNNLKKYMEFCRKDIVLDSKVITQEELTMKIERYKNIGFYITNMGTKKDLDIALKQLNEEIDKEFKGGICPITNKPYFKECGINGD